MASELDYVAESADAAAAGQRQVARRARVMRRRREAGWSWSRILDREPPPGMFELGRRSAKHMADAARTAVQIVAGGLSGEGESRRQIGRRLGVTHQRVSALLRDQQGPVTSGDR